MARGEASVGADPRTPQPWDPPPTVRAVCLLRYRSGHRRLGGRLPEKGTSRDEVVSWDGHGHLGELWIELERGQERKRD